MKKPAPKKEKTEKAKPKPAPQKPAQTAAVGGPKRPV